MTETRTGRQRTGRAECVTATDGKITYIRFMFDCLPFGAARRAAP
jgi:hypothetical protein